ncbi:histidine kinase dimerization/phospho-acceptor domain-containing protein [Thermodesulfobacteriota bacterium]
MGLLMIALITGLLLFLLILRGRVKNKKWMRELQKAEIQKIAIKLEDKVKERTVELEEKTQRLIATERMATLGEMSRKIAHELRNPLAVFGGLARRMNENPADNGRDRGYLKIMVEEVRIMENKISNIIKILDGKKSY